MNLTTLEQSKQLKAWGAPQEAFSHYIAPGEELLTNDPDEYLAFIPRETYAAYDLESLIEWLGDSFIRLTRHADCFTAGGEIDDERYTLTGINSLEAVYNLAVAIHGKEKE